mgnify:CR=1 FL=1
MDNLRKSSTPKKTPKKRKPRTSHEAKILPALQNEYELGLLTKPQISEKYEISQQEIWRFAKSHGWVYGSKRDDYARLMWDASLSRLKDHAAETVEDHAIQLAELRDKMHQLAMYELPSTVESTKKRLMQLSIIEKTINALSKAIMAERVCFGLPNEVKYETREETHTIRYEEILKSLKEDQELKIINPDHSLNTQELLS